MPQIDPEKEVNAAKSRVDLGVSTLDAETTALTGGDFADNYPVIKKERQLMQEVGLWAPVSSRQPATPDGDQPPDKGAEKKPRKPLQGEEIPE